LRGGNKKCFQNFGRENLESSHFEDQGGNGRIMEVREIGCEDVNWMVLVHDHGIGNGSVTRDSPLLIVIEVTEKYWKQEGMGFIRGKNCLYLTE
jgi:hypothetical protein